jgi:ribosomal protein L37E
MLYLICSMTGMRSVRENPETGNLRGAADHLHRRRCGQSTSRAFGAVDVAVFSTGMLYPAVTSAMVSYSARPLALLAGATYGDHLRTPALGSAGNRQHILWVASRRIFSVTRRRCGLCGQQPPRDDLQRQRFVHHQRQGGH